MSVVSIDRVTRRFGALAAIDDVSLEIREGSIHGLVGRNGAGKTTLMQLITGQDFATSGSVRVFGERPAENARVLARICFIKESQRYPEEFRVRHVLRAAPLFFAAWDAAFAGSLVRDFGLPLDRAMRKLSRGQLSAVGVVVGLASRAPLTFFDEPCLGLDPVARELFYARLVADHSEHPRTVVLSTHLIDEAQGFLDRVIALEGGRVVIDDETAAIRGSASTVAGIGRVVDVFTAGRRVIHRERLGGLASVTLASALSPPEHAEASALGLEVLPVSLQQIVISATTPGTSSEAAWTP